MRRRNLLTQVLTVNLLLITVAVVAAVLVSSPDVNLDEDPGAGLVLGFAVALTILVNVFLLQQRFRPLERLVEDMEHVDLDAPPPPRELRRGDPEEVQRLEVAFRGMVARLEAERRKRFSAALEAQEQERARVARDLHDEVNQSLTALLLRLEAARAQAPERLAEELTETKSLANDAMQELLNLARQLRPTALDDLGLEAALDDLVAGLDHQHVFVDGHRVEIATSFEAEGDFGDLSREAQLVTYRVAQEALSNAFRHSGAEQIRVLLARRGEGLELVVSDDGRGFAFDDAAYGLGIPGMRERATLIGAELQIESHRGIGTRVRLRT